MKKIHSIYVPALAVLMTLLLSFILLHQKSPMIQPTGTAPGPTTREDASAVPYKFGAEQSHDLIWLDWMVQRPLLPVDHEPLTQSAAERMAAADTSIESGEKTPAPVQKKERQSRKSQQNTHTPLSPKLPEREVDSKAITASLPPAPVQKVDRAEPLTAGLASKPVVEAISDSNINKGIKNQSDSLKSLPPDYAEITQPVKSSLPAAAQPDQETLITGVATATEKTEIPEASTANSGQTKVQEMQAPISNHEAPVAISMRTADPIPLVEEIGVDQDQVYEDILNLVKSKISVLQHQEDDSSEVAKEVLLAANLPRRESVSPIKTRAMGRHGIGIGFAAIKPMIGTKVTIPGSGEISYWYRAASRLQLQLAAGFTPLTWPGGIKSSMISGDLISHYLVQPHAKVRPMISIGLGMIRAKLNSGNSINTSSLVAGPGIGFRFSDRSEFSIQLQYKQPMTNLVRTNSLKRDAFILLKAELKFFPHKNTSSPQLTEENLVAEKD